MTYRVSNTAADLEGFAAGAAGLDLLPDAVTVRRATTADSARIRVIARLDDRRPPVGPFLVAEVTGEVVAAFAMGSGIVVADPFRPTADAVALLRLRAAQVPPGAVVTRFPGPADSAAPRPATA
jgi:hypothetical protein